MPGLPPLPLLQAQADANRTHGPSDLGLVMGGGGARAAYQVGFLRHLASRFPELHLPYITGVSAGAINAALLASHHGTFLQAVGELSELWGNLTVRDVFRVDSRTLAVSSMRWLKKLGSGGMGGARSEVRGLVDTQPLHAFLTEALHAVDGELTGIRYNLEHGRLRALAISTTSYSTGASMTWLQGTDVEEWERPHRLTHCATITVDHVMASAALPLLFPAVQLGNAWYGDGGIRLTAPLSPVLHLGARRVLAISTRYDKTAAEAEESTIYGYPPPAQVAGVLLNSIFLDLLDNDAHRLERLNRLLESLPEEDRVGLNPVKLLVLRPSRDLGKLASQFEAQLPGAFRFLTRGLGTRETKSPDILSLVLFQPDYLRTLMEIGEADAMARSDEIADFLLLDPP
ncbi:MAG: patatin-like phospholipase family protein [Gemmatimonadetes bacterium]|nr:patatin-like phospholipase family protein [Gemmatimonadota bacterium]MDA1102529.1 patatin-like phospholipase family protein [Gemmatimonadota bacterium]